MWSDERERCERQCEQCAFLKLQRCNDNHRRLVKWSERLRRVDECRVRRRLRLELQHQRQQQQHMWSDERERCERQCEQCAFLQLQRCNDYYRSLVLWSERLRRVDECRVCRRLRLEFQQQRQQQQRMWSDNRERCERQCEQCAFLQLQRCNDDQRKPV